MVRIFARRTVHHSMTAWAVLIGLGPAGNQALGHVSRLTKALNGVGGYRADVSFVIGCNRIARNCRWPIHFRARIDRSPPEDDAIARALAATNGPGSANAACRMSFADQRSAAPKFLFDCGG